MAKRVAWKVGDRVVVAGRTRMPDGFSIEGWRGQVVGTAANAEPGAVTVWLDVPAGGYAYVNVDAAALELDGGKPLGMIAPTTRTVVGSNAMNA